MTITAKVIAHSRADGAPDLITLECRYPRMVHSEFMTHRVFSRNASSSRAVPVARMIQDVIDDPAMPVAWGSNKPGMQAGEEIKETFWAKEAWLNARDAAVDYAKHMVDLGLHKQIANRILEPFAHISVVVTATDWDNFFDLRCHPDADPTIRALAEAMRDAIDGSDPSDRVLGTDGWHLPYIGENDILSIEPHWRKLAMISAARCARVSYLNHDGSAPDIEKDLKLADMLLTSKHMSPFEHQARAWTEGVFKSHLQGNLRQWYQHRKLLEAWA